MPLTVVKLGCKKEGSVFHMELIITSSPPPVAFLESHLYLKCVYMSTVLLT